MHVRVSYKEDLSEAAGAPAARRWTEEVEIDEFIPALQKLMADAQLANTTITQVLIHRFDESDALIPEFEPALEAA